MRGGTMKIEAANLLRAWVLVLVLAFLAVLLVRALADARAQAPLVEVPIVDPETTVALPSCPPCPCACPEPDPEPPSPPAPSAEAVKRAMDAIERAETVKPLGPPEP